MAVSKKCLLSKLKTLTVKAGRVFHIGDCGFHSLNCVPHDSGKLSR